MTQRHSGPVASGSTSLVAALIGSVDPDGLAAFYRETLELGSPTHVEPDHVGFTIGAVYLGIERSEAGRPPGRVTLWFHVDDLGGTASRMSAAGARDVSEPFDTDENEQGITLSDPEGNPIGLLSRTR